MVIQHRPGKKHGNADGLSRIPEKEDFCNCYEAGISYPYSHVEDVPFAPKSTINGLGLKMVLMMSFPCPSVLHPSLMISVQRTFSLLSSQVVMKVTLIGYPSIPLTNYERPNSKTQTYPSFCIGLKLMRDPSSMTSTCVAQLFRSFGLPSPNLRCRMGSFTINGKTILLSYF